MDIASANLYFTERLNTTAWDNASDANKLKALSQAERELEFYKDRVDMTRFYYAVYEQVLWLLTGDTRSELQQAGVTAVSIGSTSEQYNPGHDVLIAPRAWFYLRGPFVKTGGLR
ncbi:MAG: hypothetical protein A4E53_01198 [Pelotomaculum sp. PtaB.Bin104]|nr:MAG: hypothetical protein A4E53_01198 [Pelotomaculum sp. PtaB.Bin104]